MSQNSTDRNQALLSAVSVARFAPSVHNSQPWRWEIDNDTLRLSVDPRRRLKASDPDGRLMVFSCGAALHYARLALAAQGHPHPAVTRLAEDTVPDTGLLAVVAAGEPGETTEAAADSLRLMMSRHTDRWPVSDTPIPEPVLQRLQSAAEAEGGHFHLLRDPEVIELAAATDAAHRVIEADPHRTAELDRLTGVLRDDGTGVPAAAVNPRPGHVRVMPRRFGHGGPPESTPEDSETDASARYGLVFGTTDTAHAWLRAGEALSALWLAATDEGLSVEPFSEAIEVDTARARLTGLLMGIGYPLLVLRLGWSHAPGFAPPATPRMSVAEILRQARED
ncbi:hypothetical protein LX16_4296 [Stackebrandtia albiflava]|uniref:Nitroreductase family protein n=1 Tax=Stackebrandtia albiflava TaxID=406432 RepID=A0A562UR42_9ACTN|nr:hypothetical protein LX16_4296 [Stackebrandtia albiflava]